MKAKTNLPENYKQIYTLDLKNDKKMSLLVNLLAIVIAAAVAVPMHFVVPINTLYSMDKGLLEYAMRFVVLIVGMIVYFILHELVHGIAMKICGTMRVIFGYTGLYAFAGSEDYYDKRSYIFIALAPIVFWGAVIAVINAFVPTAWFWVVYLIQVINLSGAAGGAGIGLRRADRPAVVGKR